MAHNNYGFITQYEQDYYDGNDFGGYQFISLSDIIDNFAATFVGEGKILSNVLRSDVSFHAHRALAELTFDTFKSCKSQEIEVPPHLTMPLPQDYVNYVKLVWSDASGIEHIIYPASKTSNPRPIQQGDDTDFVGDYKISAVATFPSAAPNYVILDGEYTNIRTGMELNTQHFQNNHPPPFKIISIRNSGGKTYLYLNEYLTWIGANGTSDYEETVTITPPMGSQWYNLGEQNESGYVVENVSWLAFGYQIDATSSSDIANIKPGMLVISDLASSIGGPFTGNTQFPEGTRVVSVNGTTILVDQKALIVSVAGSELTFISDNRVSDTWSKYKGATPSENQDDYQDDTYWPASGERYGLDPQYAQVNGSFFIDCDLGKIHFSSNLSGKTIILKYISDSLGTDGEMQVHKFAEEAMYKWIAYGCLIARIDIPEHIITRFKKEKFAETRKAKLRLSNIKLEEITQILRGKSKQIKH